MELYGAKFQSGDKVRVIRNIRNDGSFRELNKGELLVEQGETGVIRSSGYFLQDQVIYQVCFTGSNRVVGVRETEVIDAGLEWIPCRFRSLDKAKLTLSLKMREVIIAARGELVEVRRVHRDLDSGRLDYEIAVSGQLVKVAARALESC